MGLKRIIQDPDKKRIGKNFASLSLLQIANMLLPLVTLPYLVRVLGTEKFGLVIFAQSFAVFFNLFVEFGFNLSATREVAVHRKDEPKINAIFSGVMLIKVLLVLSSFLILSLLVFLIPRLHADWEIFLLSFGIVIGQALFPLWYFQGIEKMSVISIINVSAKLIFTVLILFLIKDEDDYLLVPVFNSIGFIVAGLSGLYWALRKINLVIPRIVDMRILFLDSTNLFVSNLSTSLYTYSNIIILGALTNNTLVGIYSSMEKLILAIKGLFTPLFQAIFPYLSGKNTTETVTFVKKLIRPLFLLGLLITSVILIFAENILNLIYNDPQINNYSDVFKILGVIAVFTALNMLFNLLFLTSLKKYRERMKIMIIAGIFNVILGLVLVFKYGIYGMALTAALTELLLLVMGAYYFYKIKNETTNYSPDRST